MGCIIDSTRVISSSGFVICVVWESSGNFKNPERVTSIVNYISPSKKILSNTVVLANVDFAHSTINVITTTTIHLIITKFEITKFWI